MSQILSSAGSLSCNCVRQRYCGLVHRHVEAEEPVGRHHLQAAGCYCWRRWTRNGRETSRISKDCGGVEAVLVCFPTLGCSARLRVVFLLRKTMAVEDCGICVRVAEAEQPLTWALELRLLPVSSSGSYWSRCGFGLALVCGTLEVEVEEALSLVEERAIVVLQLAVRPP